VKGIILAGGTGSRLWPLTKSVCKQLLPVYDKPMIYYPLATMMLAGIREIAVITTPTDNQSFIRLLGDGSEWGISLRYIVQTVPDGIANAFVLAEDFLAGQSSMMILGDNIFVGTKLGNSLSFKADLEVGASVLGYQVSSPENYGVVEFDDTGLVLSIEEKPRVPKSNWVIPGMYFVDSSAPQRVKSIAPSARGEKEITDLLNTYLVEDLLKVDPLPRGSVWMDMGNPRDLASASDYVQIIDERQGMKISCPEEIAWRKGWITSSELKQLGVQLLPSAYGKYLVDLIGNFT
jgi:glucose-1-phosphate thymidylyltransferase